MRGARQRSHLRRCTRARRQAAKAQCDAGVRSRMAKRRRGKHTPFVIWDRHAIARAAHAPNGIRPAAQAENRSSLRRSEGPFCLINRSKSLRCRPLPGLLRRDFRRARGHRTCSQCAPAPGSVRFRPLGTQSFQPVSLVLHKTATVRIMPSQDLGCVNHQTRGGEPPPEGVWPPYI